MLELIFQGFMEWAYGLALECWEYFSSSLLDIMSMDYAYMKSHVPVMVSIAQVLLAVGWALLIGNLVFQALKSMAVGLGFEGEDPKLLFTRTFVFAFLLMASPQICEVGLSLTARIIELLEIPDAINVTLVDEGMFGSLGAAWLLVIIFGLIIMLQVFRLLLEIAERYVILAVLTMTAPLAFAMGGSKSTSEIFGGWCRMFGSVCTLMVTNVIFFKMLLSVLSNVPSGLDIIPWIVLVLTIVKVARKAEAIITRIGLNPAITGDSLGRGFPGTLTYLVMRSATSHIMLEHLILLDRHGENLLGRGLSEDRIRENGYRSMPETERGRRLLADLLRSRGHDLRGVPGFRTYYGEWTLSGPNGFLIPVRNKDGLIQGLKIRLDEADYPNRKYRWLSSRSLPNGTRSYSWVHVTGDRTRKRAFLTEGPLKGDVASFLAKDALFICIGGVNALHGLTDTIRELGVHEVVEAMDMDQMTNPNVRNAIRTMRVEVQKIPGIRYSKYTWNPAYKGVDDYLLSRVATM